MAAEFHRKTAALFEEFKKRELHFLNTEVNLNSNVNWKNNINTPLHEYMQKINKREQQTEKSYKDLMRQMEELGKQTDQMTLKLEKLNALRNVALSSNISAWPTADDTYERPFLSYYSNTLLHTAPKILSSDSQINDYPSRIQPVTTSINHPYQLSSLKYNCQSVTTQTEYIFCDNCLFPVILNSKMPVSNVNLPSTITHETITKEKEQNISHKPTEKQEVVDFLRKTIVTKSAVENQNLAPKSNYNISDLQANDHGDSMFMNERVSPGIVAIDLKEEELLNGQERNITTSCVDNAVIGEPTSERFQKRMSENYTANAVTDRQTNEPFQKRMSENYTANAVIDRQTNEPFHKRLSKSYTDDAVAEELTSIPVQKGMLESYNDYAVTGDYITHTEEKHYVEIQDNDLLSNDGNFEQTISKSDDESMSREFNFLDSDKSKIPRRQTFLQMSEDTNSQLTGNVSHNERLDNTPLEARHVMQSNPNHLLKVQQTSGGGEDLSYIAGPPSPSAYSENTSVVSESDSVSEKETPLTATAAYQALLGNVSVIKPKQKSAPSSNSDSEDEIENALANAVRRTSRIAFDTAILDTKVEKRKESIAEIKAEKNAKPIDPISTNKPQNKLSKNTRKVLGLDTSSGSEVELDVKSPTSKIEEESDEFDFYD